MGKYKNGKLLTGKIEVPNCQAKLIRNLYNDINGGQYPGFDYWSPDVTKLTNGAENRRHVMTIYLNNVERKVFDRFCDEMNRRGIKKGIDLPRKT